MAKEENSLASLAGWSEAIRESAKQFRDSRQAIREKIKEKGPADAVVITDKEYDEETRMWKIDGGVVAIPFRKGKPSIDLIISYSDSFIDALVNCRGK